jgi:diguanylate cyclase (GGDEF) domain
VNLAAFCPTLHKLQVNSINASISRMDREKFSNYTKFVVISLGAICVFWALSKLPVNLDWGYLLIVTFSILVAPRMSVSLPKSNLILSFSDAVVFLTFLIYGGELAILTACIETAANVVYLRSRNIKFAKWFLPFNSSLAVLHTTVTYGVLLLFTNWNGTLFNLHSTRELATVLGVLSLSQFFGSSFFAAVYQKIRSSESIWANWKSQGISSAFAQFAGAGLAGVAFRVITFADMTLAVIASAIFGFAYLNYRKMINEINESIVTVEEAERQKAETERERRKEAEKHANQLSVSLEKEERANVALRRSEKDLQHAALHDSLTTLANRKQLNDILSGLITNYRNDPSTSFQVLFLDIRSFKDINDMLGHTIGDKVLAIAAKRFKRLVNPNDVVARIGGDEFAIVLRNVSSSAKAHKVARRIYDSIKQPFSLSGHKLAIDLNIGIAPCDAEYSTPEEILRDADIAMHFAKERNDGLAIFTTDLRARFQERVRFEMDLRNAIERHELTIHYQPIVSLSDGNLIGFEALLRWHHSEFGNIPPIKFIPVAERAGLIQPITVWILHETCRQLRSWQQIGPEYRDLMVSVNISGKHLSNNDLIDDVESALAATGLMASYLKLEVTESSAMENAEHTIEVLNRLKQIGVQLSMDDFGTGYSSLSYLHRLPFDTLKIDRSFVYNVGENGENSEILQTIISLAKSLRLRVIAEGIETVAQFSLLNNLGCDYGQGYLLAKPKGRDETERLLYERPNWIPFTPSGDFEERQRDNANDANLPVF